MTAESKPITFLSDYGTADDFVGVCHGVIATLAPSARVIDITHGLPRHQVEPAAVVLRNTLPFMPAGVHLAVVDPEVGTERRAVAVRTAEGRLLVGPDNGLLAPAAERFGGAQAAADIGRSPHRLEPVSTTFHGRDVFAPVAAVLAIGAELESVGEPLDPESLANLALPHPESSAGRVDAHVLYVDRFGNAQLDASQEDLAASGIGPGARLQVSAGAEPFEATLARAFADVAVGEVLIYEDAYRRLAVAINRGNAARTLRLERGGKVLLRVP